MKNKDRSNIHQIIESFRKIEKQLLGYNTFKLIS